MELIDIKDINLELLFPYEKNVVNFNSQGRLFTKDDDFYKLFNSISIDLYTRLLKEMYNIIENSGILNVLIPWALIIEDYKVVGTITKQYKDSKTFAETIDKDSNNREVKMRIQRCKDVILAYKALNEAQIVFDNDFHMSNILTKGLEAKLIDFDKSYYYRNSTDKLVNSRFPLNKVCLNYIIGVNFNNYSDLCAIEEVFKSVPKIMDYLLYFCHHYLSKHQYNKEYLDEFLDYLDDDNVRKIRKKMLLQYQII